jgi:glucosylceramidase
MGWEEQRDFVIGHLAPAIKAAGLKTRIYLFDHNYNYDNITSQTDYPYKIYQAGVDSEIVVGAAYHNYGGNRSELLDIHSKAPDKELIFSEASIGEWNDGRNLQTRLMADMVDLGLGIINNWCRAVVVWNLMLDTNKGPNRNGGCQTCYGAVDIDAASYKTITRNSHYYVMAHLSDVVKPGAVRIDAAGYDQSGVSYTAFENTDGTYALVLLNNSSEARKITVGAGEHYFTYQAPANSVLSYQWSK